MNKVGKILVFINLLFSIITGALIVAVFVTRTNWEKGYGNISKQLEGERAQHIITQEKASKLLDAQNKQLQDYVANR